jgi:glutamate 5-kinase
MSRARVAGAPRTVVKVGSSSLTSRGQLDPARLDLIVTALATRHQAGQQVVLVSSGAIAAGIGRCCWPSATPPPSPATASRSGRCC